MAALATLDDLESSMQRKLDDIEYDAGQLALDQASSLVRAEAGWSISAEDGVTMSPLSATGALLTLPTLYVRTLTSVTVDGVLLGAPGYTTRGGQVWRIDGRAWGPWYARMPADVVLVVDHGYTPGDYRLDLARSVVLGVARRQLVNPDDVIQQSLGSASFGFRQAPTGEGMALLWPGEAELVRRFYGLGLVP